MNYSRQSALMTLRAGVKASRGPQGTGSNPPPGGGGTLVRHGHKKKRRHRHHHAAAAPPGQVKSEINVTPLVDVVLVLLIIFMVVTPMLHRGPEVELPITQNHSKRQDTGEQLVVTVRSDGTYLEADRVEVDKLSSVLEKELKTPRPVNVRAERSLKFGEVRKVLEQVHASGAPQVNMETKENKE